MARSDRHPAWLPRAGSRTMATLPDRSTMSHSGAVCAGAAAPCPTGGLSWSLGTWQKVFSCWNFWEPPPTRPSPSPPWGVQRLGEVPTAPCPGPWELRHCHSPAPEQGHNMGRGVPLRDPCTAAAVTPTCSHISHTNCSLHQVLIQFVAVSITTSQRFLVLSVAIWMPRSDVSGMLSPGTQRLG